MHADRKRRQIEVDYRASNKARNRFARSEPTTGIRLPVYERQLLARSARFAKDRI